MIALIDYGAGNVRSVWKALDAVGAAVRISHDPDEVLAADKVVLPGVGAFGDCMANLRRMGMVGVIHKIVARGTPFLGICVGMQVLFEEGEEMGRHAGLGLLPGRVVRFDFSSLQDTEETLKIPHTGWNQVIPVEACKENSPQPDFGVLFESRARSASVPPEGGEIWFSPHRGELEGGKTAPLLHGLASGVWAYFNHSYYCQAQPEHILAITDYGEPFSCIVGKDNVYGIQFHPEKSQKVGLHILRNFVEGIQ